MDKELVEQRKVAAEAEKTMKKLCSKIGNIVAPECPIAQDEVSTRFSDLACFEGNEPREGPWSR